MTTRAETISSNAIKGVLRDYFNEYRKNPLSSIVAFFFPAMGNIFVFFIPPLIISKLIDKFTTAGYISLDLATNSIILFGGLWLLGEIFWRIGMYFLVKIEAVGMNNLARITFSKLAEREYDFFANNFVGTLTKKASAYSRNFEGFTDAITFNLISNFFPIVFAVVVLWQYSPFIPIVLVILLALAASIAVPIIRQRSRLVAERHDASSKVTGKLSDALTNMLAIKSFAKEKEELVRYGEGIDNFTDKFVKAANFQNFRFDAVISPLYVGSNVLGIVMAISLAQQLSLSAGTILIVFSYFAQVTRIFWEFNRLYRNFENSITESAEFNELVMLPPAIVDAGNAVYFKFNDAQIEFRNVGFNYHDIQNDRDLFLKDFNLKINKFEKIGLVGVSGSGKTTITKLILRFVDTVEGDIFINDVSIKKYTQESLRKMISYVPQEPLLFHRSLRENISYANANATDEDVLEASRLAHADEFIANLPGGYETIVGERGIKLSGGQRQRVAIARAILKKSPILVLDEATSALDSESEKYIQQGLSELLKNKTAIVIAHRLSTIKNLDRIVVMQEGSIIEQGKHSELIDAGGMYAKLWSHQSGANIE